MEMKPHSMKVSADVLINCIYVLLTLQFFDMWLALGLFITWIFFSPMYVN